ncbi:hypothetical protein ANANG_G00014510 [Anguilla anguilla]|uniref:Uncharacterized protein n=1 Tax=Anguilla anguilla TaxID=7936 RepID=A0A9D3S6R9_ANGAN|nr:hypothetical protein ANANG_G00014510 [Anguilla anguilla]
MSRAASLSTASGRDPLPAPRGAPACSRGSPASCLGTTRKTAAAASPDPAFNEKEDDGEWILVDYLALASTAADACTSPCLDGAVGVCPQDMAPPDCPARYSSCSSLDSAVDEAEAEPEDGDGDGDGASCGWRRARWRRAGSSLRPPASRPAGGPPCCWRPAPWRTC